MLVRLNSIDGGVNRSDPVNQCSSAASDPMLRARRGAGQARPMSYQLYFYLYYVFNYADVILEYNMLETNRNKDFRNLLF